MEVFSEPNIWFIFINNSYPIGKNVYSICFEGLY